MSTQHEDLSTNQRVLLFKEKRIGHPIMVSVLNDLMEMFENPAGADIALLCGSTGVGKTTLLKALISRVRKEALPNMVADPGCIPLVCVTAPEPKRGSFNWKEFYVRVLDAMGEPQVEHKTVPLEPPSHKDDKPVLKNAGQAHNTLNVEEIARIAERTLINRKTRLMIIDEAQHLFHVSSGQRVMNQLEVVKGLANDGARIVLLAGTYELLQSMQLNGQLLRRTTLFNFPRYIYGENYDDFLVALKAFQLRIPTNEPSDLVGHAEYLYEYSLGLVGMLKNHLQRSLKRVLNRKAQAISRADLEATALSQSALWKILQEAKAGEKYFASLHNQDHSLRAALGFDPMPDPVKPKARNRTRIGVRAAINDEVGVEKECTGERPLDTVLSQKVA